MARVGHNEKQQKKIMHTLHHDVVTVTDLASLSLSLPLSVSVGFSLSVCLSFSSPCGNAKGNATITIIIKVFKTGVGQMILRLVFICFSSQPVRSGRVVLPVQCKEAAQSCPSQFSVKYAILPTSSLSTPLYFTHTHTRHTHTHTHTLTHTHTHTHARTHARTHTCTQIRH